MRLAGYLGAVFLVLALTDVLPKHRERAKKLWFVPVVYVLGYLVVSIVVQLLRIAGSGYRYGSPLTFRNLFNTPLAAGTMGCAGLWLACPEGLPSRSRPAAAPGAGHAAGTSSAGTAGNGYIGMAQHVLLLLLTCGIWLYVWIYRTTGYLNCLEDKKPQNPTTKLLLCMFVPFYFIYWI